MIKNESLLIALCLLMSLLITVRFRSFLDKSLVLSKRPWVFRVLNFSWIKISLKFTIMLLGLSLM